MQQIDQYNLTEPTALLNNATEGGGSRFPRNFVFYPPEHSSLNYACYLLTLTLSSLHFKGSCQPCVSAI